MPCACGRLSACRPWHAFCDVGVLSHVQSPTDTCMKQQRRSDARRTLRAVRAAGGERGLPASAAEDARDGLASTARVPEQDLHLRRLARTGTRDSVESESYRTRTA
eukprot:4681452-Pleurochrysis_carterae.AAC.1